MPVLPTCGAGHHHDLPVVRRVGERLLVAGHPGGEDRLAERLARRRRRTRRGTPARPRGRGSPSACGHCVELPSRTVGCAAQHRGHDGTGELALRARGCCATATPRRRGRPPPTADGVDQGDVGRLPDRQRAAVALEPGDPGGVLRHHPGDVGPGHRAGVTITSLTTESAVSRPSIPKAASTNACSLSCRACGAWSVATASMVPSASASRRAATSSSGRSGGLTL